MSSQRNRPTFPGGNLPSTTTIRQGVLEVKLRHQQVQIVVCSSMTHNGALLRTAPHGNMTANGMTSAMLLKIRGVSGSERRPQRDVLWQRTLLRWERVDFMLWRDHSDRSGGQTNSRMKKSIGMKAPTTLRNLFRCIKLSMIPSEEMIG
jgi:hypothetical protein